MRGEQGFQALRHRSEAKDLRFSAGKLPRAKAPQKELILSRPTEVGLPPAEAGGFHRVASRAFVCIEYPDFGLSSQN
jgi:hypothetical protein